jgi:hypothetical protein
MTDMSPRVSEVGDEKQPDLAVQTGAVLNHGNNRYPIRHDQRNENASGRDFDVNQAMYGSGKFDLLGIQDYDSLAGSTAESQTGSAADSKDDAKHVDAKYDSGSDSQIGGNLGDIFPLQKTLKKDDEPDGDVKSVAGDADDAKAPADDGRRYSPWNADANDENRIELKAGGTRAAKRWGAFWGALAGAIGGGVAGFIAGSAVPVLGNVGGLVAGAVAGGYVGAGGGLGIALGAAYNAIRGGQGQQYHLNQARHSLWKQRVTFTQQEKDNLEAVTPRQWRTMLHMSKKKMPEAADRQAYREALVLTVAKHGRNEGKAFRQRILRFHERDRARVVRDKLEQLGGDRSISAAHYDRDWGRVDQLLRQRDEARAGWRAFGDSLNLRFGQQLGEEFLGTYNWERGNEPLYSSTKDNWIGIGKHQAAVDNDLIVRMRQYRFGPNQEHRFAPEAVQAAKDLAVRQRRRFEKDEARPSATLINTGRLGYDEAEDLWEAARAAQETMHKADPNIPEPPRLRELMDEEDFRIGVEEDLLGTDDQLETKNRWPVDLFAGAKASADQLYRMCKVLDEMNADDAKQLYRDFDGATDQDRARRVDQAKGLAKLGKTLIEDAGGANAPKDALDRVAEMLRQELELRMGGARPARLDHWSGPHADHDNPGLPNQQLKDDAQKALGERNGIYAWMSNDRQFAGPDRTLDQQFLNETYDRLRLYSSRHGNRVRLDHFLANNAEGFKAMIAASATPREVIAALAGGAKSHQEAISCDRLGVDPADLARLDWSNAQRQQENLSAQQRTELDEQRAMVIQWEAHGFNRAEALAYDGQIYTADRRRQLGPEELFEVLQAGKRPEDVAFAGRHLTPHEVQQYIDLGVPCTDRTAPGYFIERNRVSDSERIGEGKMSKVYKATYRTPFGEQVRFMKEAEARQVHRSWRPAIGSNLAMRFIAEELDRADKQAAAQIAAQAGAGAPGAARTGADVIVNNEVGFLDGTMCVSMEDAGGASAADQRHSPQWWKVDPNGRWASFYNLDQATRQQARADAHKEDDIDWQRLGENDIRVKGNVMRMLRRNAEFQRQSVWLQIVGYLGGMKDRHAGNYMLRVTGQAPDLQCERLVGIDNDDALGGQPSIRSQGIGLPPVIDREQYAALRQLYNDRERIRRELTTLVGDKDARDFENRLFALVRHPPERIDRAQWGPDQTAKLEGAPNSLLARDTATWQARRLQRQLQLRARRRAGPGPWQQM